jgi:aminopeptidase
VTASDRDRGSPAAPGESRRAGDELDPAAFADLLAGYCLDVEPGQVVLVRSTSLAEPLLLELQRAILERDAWPLLRVELPGQTRSFYDAALDRHLDDYPDLALHEARRIDALLGIQAPGDVRELAGVDPERITRYARARRPIREATMKKRWCSTLWPTTALAEQASMTLEEFSAFVRRALFLDQPEPVRAWGGLGAFQERLIARLSGARELRLEAEGTDVTLGVANRTWVNSDGRRNMPSGEVFTGPLEHSANGHVRFTVRSAPAGMDVDGVELELRDGEVVAASATVGDAYLQRALATDDGARFLGEIGIGTNFGIARPTGTILFDEKIGGTVHLALGRSYPETGGKNRSALHWDLICDLRRGGRLSADGEVVQEDGRFVGFTAP